MNNLNRNLPEEVERYLKKYELPLWQVEVNNFENINCVVVIPAIAEYENIKNLLGNLSENDPTYFNKTLVLFVINNISSSELAVKKENQTTIYFLRKILQQKTDDQLIKKIISSGIKAGLIDASSAGKELPEKDGGVGLARKIGMDMALRLFNYSSPEKKILICLDADCTVDKNYLTEIYREFNEKDLSVAYLNFQHPTDGKGERDLAITCYEIFLRYYLLGLLYAKSPFAFPTIGSNIVCNYRSYIKVEGMNKRKAAEDFYFMEKLAKNFPVEKISTTIIYPSSRPSWRVPFGTGQRINRFLSHVQDEYLLYSPQSFVVLRKWLEMFNDPQIKSADEYLKEAKKIDLSLYNFLVEQKFEKNWIRIERNSNNEETLQKQKIIWFDGFKTMKLIHYLRDKEFPLIQMFIAVDELLKLFGNSLAIGLSDSGIPSLEIQKKYLEVLRKIT